MLSELVWNKMVKIKDLRGAAVRQETNSHTELLEELVEKERNASLLQKISKKVVGHAGFFASVTGAGYLAGYITSKGNVDTAIYFAEYASLIGAASTVVGIPLNLFFNHLSEKDHKKISNYQKQVAEEEEKVKELEKQGLLHTYKPEHGISFENHPYNHNSQLENMVGARYETLLGKAREPFLPAINNILAGATIFLISSLQADILTYLIDAVSGLNPIEYGIEAARYISQNLQHLAGYTPKNACEYADNFNQLHMAYTGAAFGLLYASKEFFLGSYYRAKALARTIFRKKRENKNPPKVS